MTDKGLPVRGNISFEGIKQVNEHGAEYWSATGCNRSSVTASGGASMRRSSGRWFLANSPEIDQIITLPASAK